MTSTALFVVSFEPASKVHARLKNLRRANPRPIDVLVDPEWRDCMKASARSGENLARVQGSSILCSYEITTKRLAGVHRLETALRRSGLSPPLSLQQVLPVV